MKRNMLKSIFGFFAAVVLLTNCTSVNKSMREPNSRVDFVKSDFTFSEQVNAEAQTTKILGVDWNRLFRKETGTVEGGGPLGLSLSSIPVVGNFASNLGDRTSGYALRELMVKNPGYDVVFYPQYETTVERPALGIGFIYKKTTVKVTARLAKIK